MNWWMDWVGWMEGRKDSLSRACGCLDNGSCVQSIMCKWTRPFWGTDCRRAPKSLSSAPRQPLFAVPALRELESACRVSILWDAVQTVPTGLLFRDSAGVAKGLSSSLRPKPSASICSVFFFGSKHPSCDEIFLGRKMPRTKKTEKGRNHDLTSHDVLVQEWKNWPGPV